VNNHNFSILLNDDGVFGDYISCYSLFYHIHNRYPLPNVKYILIYRTIRASPVEVTLFKFFKYDFSILFAKINFGNDQNILIHF